MSGKVADLFAALRLKPEAASWKAGDKLIAGIKAGLAAIVTFGAVKWAKGVVDQVAQVTDRFAKMSQSVGTGIEPLQELAHATELSGGTLDDLRAGLLGVTKAAKGAAAGGKEQAAAFRAIGVSARDVLSGAVPMEEVISRAADVFATMPDGATKSALAMKLFEESGTKLIPMLNSGSAGIAAMRQEARDLGIVVDRETAAAFEQFNDDQTRLKRTLDGLKIEVVRALLPMLQEMVTSLRAWVAANRQLIRQALAKIIKGIAIALKAVGAALVVVFELIDVLAKHWKLVVVAMATAILMKLIPAILALRWHMIRTAIVTAAAWVAANLPLVLMAALIAALILVVEDLYRAFTGGDSILKDAWTEGLKFLRQKFDAFANGVKKRIDELAAGIAGLMPKSWRDGATDFVMGNFGFGKRITNSLEEERSARRRTEAHGAAAALLPGGEFLPALQHMPATGGSNTVTVTVDMRNTINEATDAEEVGRQIARQVTDAFDGAARALVGGTP